MKLNPNQQQRLVQLIAERIDEAGFLVTKDYRTLTGVIDSIIAGDLKKEEEIEKEALALIKKHAAAFHSNELDHELLARRAKLELARKKGFKL